MNSLQKACGIFCFLICPCNCIAFCWFSLVFLGFSWFFLCFPRISCGLVEPLVEPPVTGLDPRCELVRHQHAVAVPCALVLLFIEYVSILCELFDLSAEESSPMAYSHPGPQETIGKYVFPLFVEQLSFNFWGTFLIWGLFLCFLISKPCFFSFSRQNHAESFRNFVKNLVLDPKCLKFDKKSEIGHVRAVGEHWKLDFTFSVA